ncbi:MAG TPA: DUF1573 domain-containing protein [Pirellulales bacterium]|nr:DUF1573 domain-containing protein [Pirellulales bacterium]
MSACLLLAVTACQRSDSDTGAFLPSQAAETSGAPAPAARDGRTPATAAANGEQRDLLFEHDFGLIRPRQHVTHVFAVTNSSQSTWTLRHIERNCVCTVAKCPLRICPGDTAEVDVEYRAGGAIADDRRAVELYFRETAAPLIRFEVRAAIRPAIAPSCKEVIFRGGKNCRARQTFEIENFSGADWSTVAVAADAPWAAADAELDRVEQSALGPRQVWQVRVDLDARGMKPGRYNAVLHIDCGGGTGERLPIWLDLAAPVAVIPQRMFFGNIGPDGRGTCSVRVICAACTADELAKRLVLHHDLGERLKLELGPRSSKVLELTGTLQLPDDSSAVEGSLILQIADEDATRIELPVLARR